MSNQNQAQLNVVKLLNNLLEMDRGGMSTFFLKQNLVKEEIADTPIELTMSTAPGYHYLLPLGMINGLLHVAIGDNAQRIVPAMRTPVLIESFQLVDTPDVVVEAFASKEVEQGECTNKTST